MFVVSYATKNDGFDHDTTIEFPGVFVAGSNTPAFDVLPNHEKAYFVTIIKNGEISACWRKSKDTLKFEKQYRFQSPGSPILKNGRAYSQKLNIGSTDFYDFSNDEEIIDNSGIDVRTLHAFLSRLVESGHADEKVSFGEYSVKIASIIAGFGLVLNK